MILRVSVLGAVLLVAGAVAVHSVLTWDPRGPDVKDARACPGSNASLAEVTGHFRLPVPPDATDVHFSSDLHPLFGEYSLRLSFRTTASGLRAFLDGSGLPAPGTDTEPVDGPSCGFGSSAFRRPRYYGGQQEGTGGPFQREAAVDVSDPARPRVVASAMDL
ncbi:hypothetical protein [Actinomadura violacea]|uniref:Secreted protein n=1 Tax=Actinomadura violacea TaxID=2819934 RepID=A0ABS3RJH4_9ACTN|nr:hypothetical protein [Actinomadura violacea]MBO2456234.1 hypothetical protein [Actinomadura violacea]